MVKIIKKNFETGYNFKTCCPDWNIWCKINRTSTNEYITNFCVFDDNNIFYNQTIYNENIQDVLSSIRRSEIFIKSLKEDSVEDSVEDSEKLYLYQM